jgi:hypothetical protein
MTNMQRRASDFTGYTIEASDGKVGVVSDILFEDQNWKLRWFVINTGSWLMGRKILIHPAALERPDIGQRAFPVSLTKLQVEASPDLRSDQPVSGQMDQDLSDYYGYSSMWGDSYYGGQGLDLFGDGASEPRAGQTFAPSGADDRQLLSIAEITGFPIHALDGDIGHLDDFLVDDGSWTIEFAVVATKNWIGGRHVLISPADIRATNVPERYVPITLTRYKIKCSPSWKAPDWSDRPV